MIWTDPNRESVGERKHRKLTENTKRKKEESRMLRASVSTHSSNSSGFDKPLPGVFGNYDHNKKADTELHGTPQRTEAGAESSSGGGINRRGSIFGSHLSPISSANSHSHHPVRFVENGPSQELALEVCSESSPGLASRGKPWLLLLCSS